MGELFPLIRPAQEAAGQELPPCREVAWDYQAGRPLFRRGAPVIATGTEAVKAWAWKALMTQRARFPIYSWEFGCELETLIGQDYSEELKQAEAARYVREALEVNPYILGVSDIRVSFLEGRLRIEALVETRAGGTDASGEGLRLDFTLP